jgi:hypothetical protein
MVCSTHLHPVVSWLNSCIFVFLHLQSLSMVFSSNIVFSPHSQCYKIHNILYFSCNLWRTGTLCLYCQRWCELGYAASPTTVKRQVFRIPQVNQLQKSQLVIGWMVIVHVSIILALLFSKAETCLLEISSRMAWRALWKHIMLLD